MSVQPCPHCASGTKVLARITTREGYTWLLLQRYASCECRLDAMDRVRLIRAAEQEAQAEVRQH